MGFIANAVRSAIQGPKFTRDPSLALWFGQGPTASGVTVSESNALNYAAFWGAVNLIANSVATLPLNLYRRLPNGGREPFIDHPLYRILHDEFNPEMSSFKARQMMQAHVLTWGNAYAEIERGQDDRVLNLWPITPDRVTPDRISGEIVYRINADRGQERRVPAADMLHLTGLTGDGLVGYSVIRRAREELGIGIAAQNFGAQFFGNGAVSGLVAMHPGQLTPNAIANLRKSIQDQIGGDKKHNLLVLEENMKVEKTTIPPDDAQFIETFRMTTLWICQRFNLPPHKLAELERATFSNIEHQAIEYVQDCLMPYLVGTEQECNRKLVRPLEKRIQYVKHKVDALLRGDALSRAQALEIRRRNGTLNADEWRELEEENPLPNGQGQMYLVPLNMVPADRVEEIIDKQVEPAAPAAAPTPAATEPQNGNRPRSDAAMKAKMIAALRANIVDRMNQAVRREAQAARRAAKKGSEGFKQWRAEFYPRQAVYMRDALMPAIQTHLIYVAATIGSQEATRQLVEEYIARSQAEIDGLPNSAEMENAVDQLVSRWENLRPSEVADGFMTDELGHALSLED